MCQTISFWDSFLFCSPVGYDDSNMLRSREVIGAVCLVAATSAGGLAINEYLMTRESAKAVQENNQLDECVNALTKQCLTAAGVELQLTYNDLQFESEDIIVKPSYFTNELHSKRRAPVDPASRRLAYGTGGAALGAASLAALKHLQSVFNAQRETAKEPYPHAPHPTPDAQDAA